MLVSELITHAVDYYDNITVDECMRAIRNVIRDINASFRGVYKRVDCIDGVNLYNGYTYKNTRLTGTVEIAPGAVPATDPSEMTGNNTEFTQELVVGDYIIVNNIIYRIASILDDDNATIQEPNITVVAGASLYKITSFTTFMLNGMEKTVLRIIVDNLICREVREFDRCHPEDYSFIRRGYNEVEFNNLPDFPKIEIEGLYALTLPENKGDEILDFPPAWDGILTNGILFYLARRPKTKDADAVELYGSQYYNKLRNFAENTGVSLPVDYSAWDYANARKM